MNWVQVIARSKAVKKRVYSAPLFLCGLGFIETARKTNSPTQPRFGEDGVKLARGVWQAPLRAVLLIQTGYSLTRPSSAGRDATRHRRLQYAQGCLHMVHVVSHVMVPVVEEAIAEEFSSYSRSRRTRSCASPRGSFATSRRGPTRTVSPGDGGGREGRPMHSLHCPGRANNREGKGEGESCEIDLLLARESETTPLIANSESAGCSQGIVDQLASTLEERDCGRRRVAHRTGTEHAET